MSNNYKQKHAKVQEILNAAEKGGGGSGGTSDYTDLTNKPSINSVTLSGNKTSYDLGIDEVPEVNSSDGNKFLKAMYDSEKEKGTYFWAPVAPTVEYADWGNVHLSYQGAHVGITGTYEVEYNGFATIIFNTDYRDIAQTLSTYPNFQGLEADFTIALTRDQQDYHLIYTKIYFPCDSYSNPQLNFITTNSNFSLALPVLAGDEISLSISSSNGIDQQVGAIIENRTKLECFVQKYV